jgi:DNA-binding SARP family transcriptional activator
LLVDAGRTVSNDELVSRLWDDEAPAAARTTLHSHVMRLRRTLGDAVALLTRPDGYVIDVAPEALDVNEFESLLRQARTAADDPATAAALLRTALDLWRGDPLPDVPSAYLHRDVVPLWQEHRLAAIESRVEADLRLGRHRDVTTELADLTIRHPLRERFWALRMLALYRAGRPAEALHCYAIVRKRLADELGVDPSAEIRDLHQAILIDDPSLTVTPPVARGRNDLPGDIPDFVGRTAEFDRLLALVPAAATAVTISAIDGMAGIGKTTLAIHAAHRLAEKYPDAQLFLDLHAHTEQQEPMDPAVALDILLRALDVPPDRIPAGLDERAALWRAELANRRVLLVLDNAASTGQVRPLLPGSPTCLALITSRRQLTDLDTTGTLSLNVLSEADALALFTSVVGTDRVAADQESTLDVLRLCGYLPLAIRIAAARLRSRPAWPVRVLADRLRDESRRHDELTVGDRSVTAALALSYQRLAAPQQRLFALLGQHPGTTFDGYQAAALGGIPLADAERLVGELVDMHLVKERAPGRYRLHDLVRQYARTKTLVPEPVRHDAVGRLLDHYLYLARLTDAYLAPDTRYVPAELIPPGPVPDITDEDQVIQWCERELRNLMAAIDYAATNGWRDHAWQLASGLALFFSRRGYTSDWIASFQVAAELVAYGESGDELAACDLDRARVLRELGNAYDVAGRYSEAITVMAEALALYRLLGDLRGEGSMLNNIGNIYMSLDRLAQSLSYLQQALAVRNRAGDLPGTAVILSNLCIVYQRLDRYQESVDCGLRSLQLYTESADRRGQAMAHNNIAVIYVRMGRLADAVDHSRRAVALVSEVGDRRGESATLNTLGMIHRHLGDYAAALDYDRRALEIARDVGDFSMETEAREGIEETERAAAQAEAAHRS